MRTQFLGTREDPYVQLNGVHSDFLVLNPVDTYYLCAANVIMCFQVVVTLSLRSVLVKFNGDLKHNMENASGEQLTEKLQQTMQTHARLFRLVKSVDGILAVGTRS